MAETKYEYYDDPEGNIAYRLAHWGAQTFTPQADHTLTRIVLYVYTPDAIDVIFSIKATDGSGHPTGEDLRSKTISGPFGTSMVKYTIDFDVGLDVTNGTKYAIVARAPVAEAGEEFNVARRWTDPAYPRGSMEDSVNSGVDWSTLGQDWSFEEWEVIVEAAPTVTTQATGNAGFNAVKGNGTIVSKGGLTVTKRGFCYNTTGDPDVSDNVKEETGDFATGAFSLLVDGLSPNTHYYLKAYAYNSEGYGYGATVEFDTNESRQVTATLSSRLVGATPPTTTYEAIYGGTGVVVRDPTDTDPDNLCAVDDHYTTSPWLFRTFMFFNLESLAGLKITNVILKFWCYSVDPEYFNPFCITEGLQDDPVVLANWVPQNAVTTILGQKEQDDFVVGQYNEIALNSDGLDLVRGKLGSVLKFCLRTKRDIDYDFDPTLHDSMVYVYLPHESGKEPMLEFSMGRSQVQVIS